MSDAQLDTIIEKLDKIIEQIMLGGVTAPAVYRPGPDLESVKGMTRETLEMRDTDVVLGLRDTPVSDDDEVSRWTLPGGHSRILEVTKRHGVVIDVHVLSS